MSSNLVELAAGRRVILCVGPGGVGKTTTSAALALAAAEAGRRVVVLTIDPARRLTDALGVVVGNTPSRVTLGPEAKGELWAVMLDQSSTLDDLVRRIAPTPATADRLLGNVIYRQMSRALAGTLEYTAIEKLYDLRERQGFDLVIVDTPPSKNVVDFIEAPEWLLRFLDERIFKWFTLLGGGEKRGVARIVLQRTARAVGDVLGKVFGDSFVTDFNAFVRDLEGMTAELRKRAANIQMLLRSTESGFVVVTTPDPFVLADAVFLRNELGKRALSFTGFVVNRANVGSGVESPEAVAKLVEGAIGGELAKKLAATALDMNARAREDAAAVSRLRRDARWEGYVGIVPREVEEIHDLDALRALSRHL